MPVSLFHEHQDQVISHPPQFMKPDLPELANVLRPVLVCDSHIQCVRNTMELLMRVSRDLMQDQLQNLYPGTRTRMYYLKKLIQLI